MKEKELIDKCRGFVEECKNLSKENKVLLYKDEPIENLVEQLLILIESYKEERQLHIKENNILFDRLSYLFNSDTIKKYDEKDGKGKYVRNIKELDEGLEEKNYFNKYIEKEKEISFNQGIINQLKKDMMLYEQIGYLKGKNKIDPIKITCDKDGYKIENSVNTEY